MLCDSKNFQHIEKISSTNVENLVPLKFQVNRIKKNRVVLIAELTNAVLRKICLKV